MPREKEEGDPSRMDEMKTEEEERLEKRGLPEGGRPWPEALEMREQEKG